MMNLQSIIKDLSNVVADNMAYEEKRAILQNTYKTIKDDLNLFLGVFDEEIDNWSVEDSLSVNSDMMAIMSTKKVFKRIYAYFEEQIEKPDEANQRRENYLKLRQSTSVMVCVLQKAITLNVLYIDDFSEKTKGFVRKLNSCNTHPMEFNTILSICGLFVSLHNDGLLDNDKLPKEFFESYDNMLSSKEFLATHSLECDYYEEFLYLMDQPYSNLFLKERSNSRWIDNDEAFVECFQKILILIAIKHYSAFRNIEIESDVVVKFKPKGQYNNENLWQEWYGILSDSGVFAKKHLDFFEFITLICDVNGLNDFYQQGGNKTKIRFFVYKLRKNDVFDNNWYNEVLKELDLDNTQMSKSEPGDGFKSKFGKHNKLPR